MIVTTSKHGRKTADYATLLAHLLKPENESIEILEIGNSVAADISGVLDDIWIFRDGSQAKYGLIHCSINPAKHCTREALLAAANSVRVELDPDGTRPWIIIAHVKARATATSDASKSHAHLVLGTISTDGSGRALNDFRSKIRTECVARIWEFAMRPENGGREPATLGRHHKTVLKFLGERGRHDVRNWLIEAFGEDPEKPRSAMSSRSRQKAKRVGLNLPKAKAAVVAAWSQTGEIAAFRVALAAAGYELIQGKKVNVWVVIDKDGNAVGSLDRLLRMKRHEIKDLMEKSDDRDRSKSQSRLPTADDQPRAEAVRQVRGDMARTVPADTAAGVTGTPRSDRRRGSDRKHPEAARSLGNDLATSNCNAVGNRLEARCPARKFEYGKALNRLREIGRLVALSAVCARTKHFSENIEESSVPWTPDRTDIWGVPIGPPIMYRP